MWISLSRYTKVKTSEIMATNDTDRQTTFSFAVFFSTQKEEIQL